MLFQTDNNGNAMLQSFLPILSGNKSDEDTRTEKTGGGNACFLMLFVHAAARGGTCASNLKIVNTLIKHGSRDERVSVST